MDHFRIPDLDRLTEAVKDTLTVRRVFGEPVKHNGALIIPVARVSGGSGVGFGSGTSKRPSGGEEDGAVDTGAGTGDGGGGGFGVNAKPEGIYVIRDGEARWVPALDTSRVAVGGMLLGGMVILSALIASLRQRG